LSDHVKLAETTESGLRMQFKTNFGLWTKSNETLFSQDEKKVAVSIKDKINKVFLFILNWCFLAIVQNGLKEKMLNIKGAVKISTMDTELLNKSHGEQHQQEKPYWVLFLFSFQMCQNHDCKLKRGSVC